MIFNSYSLPLYSFSYQNQFYGKLSYVRKFHPTDNLFFNKFMIKSYLCKKIKSYENYMKIFFLFKLFSNEYKMQKNHRKITFLCNLKEDQCCRESPNLLQELLMLF